MAEARLGGWGNPGSKTKNEVREGRKRPRPELYAYLTLGKSRHALFPNAGWNSSARCGASPHWADPVGWCGQVPEEKEKLLALPWCGRCKKLVRADADFVAALPPKLREMLLDGGKREPGGGVLHG